MLFADTLVLVRGAGDLATGVIHRLHLAGFPVIASETPQPLAVRRTVAFAQAVYDGAHTVEGVTATRVEDVASALALATSGRLPVLPIPGDEAIDALRPTVLVDARLLKRHDAARLAQASLVIGLGPGFVAGCNCHAAIETNRGHRLGRVLWQGATEANTGAPGSIQGYTSQRLVRAPAAGVFRTAVAFGQWVEQGQPFGWIEMDGTRHSVLAPLTGMVRGLLHPGLEVESRRQAGRHRPSL